MTRAVRERILKDVNGNINDHLRNHIHLTNCIHVKNHMHKHSPILPDRALLRDLVALQRSRSLQDPSTSPHSWHSPSTVDTRLRRAEKDEQVTGRRSIGIERPRMSGSSPQQGSQEGERRRGKREEGSHSVSRSLKMKGGYRQDLHLSTLSEHLQDAPDDSNNVALSLNHGNNRANNRAKRRRYRGSRRPQAPSVTNQDTEAHNEISVASNSFSHVKNRNNVSGGPDNVCGIPWNWSRIHDRGKSIIDLAGRSLSCGTSEARLRKAGSNMPVMSQHSSSSSKSNGQEAFPLLLDGSQGSGDSGAAWLPDSSGELGLYVDNLFKNETDSDLAYEGRHQNITQTYMPRRFRDLVGQSLVVQALSNAITKKKVGLLYLFYGPHGTGKMSCARIFARALNCHSLEHPKPCGLCSSCSRARNVKELGPLSNFNFEGLIKLLDVMGPRAHSQYRVLIFDECDALSSECWCSILKAIDQAPRRVVFVLVCSSFDALPHMIISRCQKFFFPKLKDMDIIYTLQWIATKEGLEIDKDALKLIASKSDGSLRDAEMTLEQLSLLGKRISLGLVQELVGLISDEKLVDLLDSALSADTVNTVKSLRDIMESGVEPLTLMLQLATVITDILAGSYDFMKEGSRRKFFRHNALSKEDMEKLRQALKTLSEAEKQLRVSNDRITWLTASLLQLAPDQQYMLPATSADAAFHHSPVGKPRKSNADKSKGIAINGAKHRHAASNTRGRASKDELPGIFPNANEEIWLQVLETIPIDSVREFMHREGKLISVSYGAAPTVQLLFTSQLTKSEAEKFRLHILQAFESVLKSPVIVEIRCGLRKGPGAGPTSLPAHQDIGPTAYPKRPGNRDSTPPGVSRTEIVELEASPREIARDRRNAGNSSSQKISSLLGEGSRSLSIVRSKVSLGHVIQHPGGVSRHDGWSTGKAVSIAEKLERENLRLEPRSRRLLCWNPPKATRRKLSRLKSRARKPRALLRYVSCGRCCGSPRRR